MRPRRSRASDEHPGQRYRDAPNAGPASTLAPLLHSDPIHYESGRHGEGAAVYLRAVRARKWLVGAIVAATVLGSLLWLSVRTPSYEATSQLLVTAISDDSVYLGLQILRESADPTRTIQTAASLVESRAAAERTAEEMGDGWTADSVLDSIEVKPAGESNILAVVATTDDPDESAKLANTFAEQTIAVRSASIQAQVGTEIQTLEQRLAAGGPGSGDLALRLSELESLQGGDDPTLSISQLATPPGSPSGAGAPLILVLALLGGIAIGSATAVLLELVDRRIREEDELLSRWPLPVLARVPLVRSRQLNGHVPPAVREAFRTLAVQLERPGEGHAIMVTSASTGDGKTTSAVNLATGLAAAGHRVVLLDFDVRKPTVAMTLDIPARDAVTALMTSSQTLKEMLTGVPGLSNLAVLAIERSGSSDVSIERVGKRMPDLLAEARELADFVVVDTAPLGEVSDALRIVQSVDEIIVVARLGNTDRSSLAVARDLIERSGLTPSGLIVLGAAHVSSSYHESGRALRDPVAASSEGRARRTTA